MKKETQQKIACVIALVSGITISAVSFVTNHELLLVLGVPIFSGGLAYLGSILDPRSRYFVTYHDNSYFNESGQYVKRRSPNLSDLKKKMPSMFFSEKSRENDGDIELVRLGNNTEHPEKKDIRIDVILERLERLEAEHDDTVSTIMETTGIFDDIESEETILEPDSDENADVKESSALTQQNRELKLQ